MNNYTRLLLCILSICFFTTCGNDPAPAPIKPKTTGPKVSIPKFDRDSAFTYIQKQVDFGPRVPNSAAHQACKNWLVEKFKNFGATVIEQDFDAKAYTGTILKGTNIIARYNPNHQKRVLLFAHWDSRHIADHDPDASKQDEPILGADDGGSGVGVLLEVARQLQKQPIDLGVDIVLFDAEDYGDGSRGGARESWCLGSQHWSKNLHSNAKNAKYGILLDMVGTANARFAKEGTSMKYAPALMNKIWKLAQGMGYGNFFLDEPENELTDDHLFVNMIAQIKTIDIINRKKGTTSGFGPHWHTHKDGMNVIDNRTLKAVGQVVLAVIYKESEGSF